MDILAWALDDVTVSGFLFYLGGGGGGEWWMGLTFFFFLEKFRPLRVLIFHKLIKASWGSTLVSQTSNSKLGSESCAVFFEKTPPPSNVTHDQVYWYWWINYARGGNSTIIMTSIPSRVRGSRNTFLLVTSCNWNWRYRLLLGWKTTSQLQFAELVQTEVLFSFGNKFESCSLPDNGG